MSLTPEQKQAVAGWVTAGDNLSQVQKKLLEQFKLSLTYRDVRFLVDDLELTLKDAAPKIDASDVTKVQAAPAAPSRPAPGAAPGDPADGGDEAEAEDFPGNPPAEGGNVSVAVDKVTLIPGAIASGTVTFSDGVTGKWIVDHQGRPGFTQISQPGYRPSAADGQAFIQQLSMALQRQGY
ncbi:MAG TPA: hypothetical protein PLU52_13105 [Opitutaceae bacterium]|nr:hypothetical protein [Opitutaceae bacterium]HND61891.1 hypothetical protein [Opitutaceae bacterium]